jgi:hypothetical protein
MISCNIFLPLCQCIIIPDPIGSSTFGLSGSAKICYGTGSFLFSSTIIPPNWCYEVLLSVTTIIPRLFPFLMTKHFRGEMSNLFSQTNRVTPSEVLIGMDECGLSKKIVTNSPSKMSRIRIRNVGTRFRESGSLKKIYGSTRYYYWLLADRMKAIVSLDSGSNVFNLFVCRIWRRNCSSPPTACRAASWTLTRRRFLPRGRPCATSSTPQQSRLEN